MKSKVLLSIVTVAALVIGFYLGRWHTSTSWNRFVEHYDRQREANAIQGYVRALTYFRDGRQEDALMVLETLLNSSLMRYVHVSPAEREDFVARAIAVAREYRAQHPRKGPSDELNRDIQRILETPK